MLLSEYTCFDHHFGVIFWSFFRFLDGLYNLTQTECHNPCLNTNAHSWHTIECFLFMVCHSSTIFWLMVLTYLGCFNIRPSGLFILQFLLSLDLWWRSHCQLFVFEVECMAHTDNCGCHVQLGPSASSHYIYFGGIGSSRFFSLSALVCLFDSRTFVWALKACF